VFKKKPNKRWKLALSQEEFDGQAEFFLIQYGFPSTDEYRKLFAAFVQVSPDSEDDFDPEYLAKCIRKAKAKEYAFYLMHPERRKKAEAPVEAVDAKVEKA